MMIQIFLNRKIVSITFIVVLIIKKKFKLLKPITFSSKFLKRNAFCEIIESHLGCFFDYETFSVTNQAETGYGKDKYTKMQPNFGFDVKRIVIELIKQTDKMIMQAS